MAVMGVTRFERFFRAAAELDVHKEDLKRYNDFINRKVQDLLIQGQATAKANGRDVIEPQDLPVTKGLHESMQQFRRLDQEIQVEPLLEQLTPSPQLHLGYTDGTLRELPTVAGGLSVALARAFKLLDPHLKSPHTEQWERTFRLFDLLV